MKKKEKVLVASLLGALGLIILLLGLFTSLFEFMHGLIAAIAIWILAGILKDYWGVKKKR